MVTYQQMESDYNVFSTEMSDYTLCLVALW
jgi:hypothetical protein